MGRNSSFGRHSGDGAADYPSTAASFVALVDATESLGEKFTQISQELSAVPATIKGHQRDGYKRRVTLLRDGSKIQSELEKAELKVQKSKEKLESLQRKAEDSLFEFNQAKNKESASVLSKLGKRSELDQRAAEKADREYQGLVQELAALQHTCWEGTLPPILSEVEDIEKSSLSNNRSYLENVAAALEPLAITLSEAAKLVHQGAAEIDSGGDVRHFVAQHASDRPMQQAFARVGAASSSAPAVAERADSAMPDAVVSSPGSSTQDRFVPPADSGLVGLCNARSLHAYVAEDENELSFTPGDLIRVLQKDESGWWQGELFGSVGVFPSNFIEEEPLGTDDVSGGGNIVTDTPSWDEYKRCQAIYAYAPQDEYDLEFEAGDILYIVDESARTTGWLFCYDTKGNYGRAPANYVDESQDQ